MKLFELLRIAIRYSFNYRVGYLSSFLSALSIIALILAVSLLIIVLSIMNGFDKEMRDRILSVVPHVTLYKHDFLSSSLPEESTINSHPGVVGAEYFSTFDSLIFSGKRADAASVLVFDFGPSTQEARLLRFTSLRELANLQNSDESIIIGSAMARRLKVSIGDKVSLILPGNKSKGYHSVSARLAIQGLIKTGTQVDENLVILPMHAAIDKFPMAAMRSAVNIYIEDVFDAPKVGRELAEKFRGYSTGVTHWFQTHGNLYSAIQLSRDLVNIMLISVIGIAAFNIVASLVLMVMDKRADIAILRTLGASPIEIGIVFVMIGLIIGVIGVVVGSIVGILLSQYLPATISYFEKVFDFKLLSTDVYPIDFIPVDVLSIDIFIVGCSTLVMCLLATIYPAMNAAKIRPARILQNDIA